MFSFLKSDESTTKVIDKVWMSSEARLTACLSMAQLNPLCLFVAWFEASKARVEARFSAAGILPAIVLARDLTPDSVAGKMLVFVEHYPLRRREEELFAALALNEVAVLSALDEPLLMYFGGEKTIELMKKLGMPETEAIGNTLLAKSIRNAQRKIDEQVQAEQPASAAPEWFKLNLPQKNS